MKRIARDLPTSGSGDGESVQKLLGGLSQDQ
jgi:hypothetical protein